MSVKPTYEELERYGRQADITIENLEQKLAESQREFRAADATIENLQMQLNAEREAKLALAAENAGLKESRAILVENTLETCNEIASAGFRHEAIMRGLYESTGNRNKYPKPITTLVDEALRKLETPATDAYMSERGE